MGEQEARDRLNVSCETLARLEAFVALVRQENETQNLVSRTSLNQIWSRHVLDSAQLFALAQSTGTWVDLGTGAGFPGLIVALLRPEKTTLIEARKLRADFLHRAVGVLEIEDKVEILCAKAEAVPPRPFAAISARAFAPLDKAFSIGSRFAAPETKWLLPKGRNAKTELEAARASWQGDFRLEPSLTDPESWIIVAEQVRRKGKGKKTR